MKSILKGKIKYILLYLVYTICSAFFISMLPYVTSQLIENIPNLTVQFGIKAIIAYVVSVCGILGFEYLRKISSYEISRQFTYAMRKQIVDNVLSFSYQHFHKNESSYYLSIISEDIPNIFNDYFSCYIDLTASMLSLIVYTVFMFVLNPILAAVILFFVIISVVMPEMSGKKLSALRKEQARKNAEYIGCVKELFDGFDVVDDRTIQALKNLHDKRCAERENITYKYGRFKSFVEIFAGLTLYIINIAAFATGIIMINLKALTAGSFVGLQAYIDLVAVPARDIIYQLIGIKSSKEVVQKYKDTLVKAQDTQKEKKYMDHKIEVKNLKVNIGSFELFADQLTIHKGEKIAVIGKSGAGKSTLLKALMGKYTDYTGDIRMDNVPIDDCDISYIISDITQRPILFKGSIYENISLFGSYDVDNVQVNQLLEELESNSLINKEIAENGENLSGGERNIIAFLRALARKSDVLFCDEMFSGLDEKRRNLLLNMIMKRDNLTVVEITHNLSEEYLGRYDHIIEVENGVVSSRIESAAGGCVQKPVV